MTVKIKKRYLIIFGIILLGIIFYIKHYDLLVNSEIDVSFKVSIPNNEISFDKTQIVFERIDKPWYSMWQRYEIAQVSPNQDGIVWLKLRKSKRYLVRVYMGEKETYYGGIEFEADTIKENQILIISPN